MELWTKLLQFLDTQMETPLPYGPFHLLWLAITVVTSVLLAVYSPRWKEKTIQKIVLVTAIVTIALEVYKQINFTFGDGSGVPAYQWYAFPWQFCSTPMYIGLLAGLTRKGRLQDALCAYLATFSVFAGIAVMFYPTTVFIGTVGINIQTMVCHGGMVAIGVLLLASGRVKPEWKTLVKALPVFLVMVLSAAVMNEIAYHSGLLESHTFNMFFISPYCDPALPVYSLVQGVLPFPWCLAVYVLGFTAAAGIVLGAAIGIHKVIAGKRQLSPVTVRFHV